MMSTEFILQEYARRYTILPTSTIIKHVNTYLIDKVKEFVGSDIFEKLAEAVEEGITCEVSEILTTENIDKAFSSLAEKFWLRLALPMFDINQKVFSFTVEDFSRMMKLEEDIAYEVTRLLRSSGYKYAEELVYGLSAMVDYDTWLLKKVSEINFEGFIKRLWERGLEEMLQLSVYIRYLFFAWTSATSAILKIVKRYREENIDILTKWCKTYAEEVETYIDTIDTLLDDESYKIIEKLEIVRK